MKRVFIVILSLVLCFMLSCDEETLDKIFIQGGMDAQSPRIIVAVDPDRVDAYERGEIVSLKEKSSVLNEEDIEEPIAVYSSGLSEKDVEDIVDKAVSDIKKHIDSLLSSDKKEILEEVKNLQSLSPDSSREDYEKALVDDVVYLIQKDIKEYIDSVSKEVSDEIAFEIEGIIQSSLNKELSEFKDEISQYFELNDTSYKEAISLVEPDITINGIKYVSKPKGYEVLGGEEDLTSIMIPESINGINVISVREGAFKNAKEIKGDLILPKTIVSIGEEAFMNCSGLNGRLFIPSSLQSIGERAFYGCNSLKGDLVIPDSLEEIGDEAFAYCTGLGKGVYGGRGLVKVGKDIFSQSAIVKSYLPPLLSEELGF